MISLVQAGKVMKTHCPVTLFILHNHPATPGNSLATSLGVPTPRLRTNNLKHCFVKVTGVLLILKGPISKKFHNKQHLSTDLHHVFCTFPVSFN